MKVRQFVVSAEGHAPPSGAEPHSSPSADTSTSTSASVCPLCGSSCVRSFRCRPPDDNNDDVASVSSKRREPYLSNASLLLSTAQKRDLFVTPGSDTTLFDWDLLEKVSSQVKEDSIICSSLSMSKLAVARSLEKGKSSASFSSPARPLCVLLGSLCHASGWCRLLLHWP